MSQQRHARNPALVGAASTPSFSFGSRRGTSTTPTASSAAADILSQTRMAQILDDQDHNRCSQGNRRALLAENLDQLRGLVKVVEADDWKYTSSGSGS